MARFVLELEHFSALIEGHLLELHDPTSNLTIELMVDPHIGWVRLIRAILDAIAPPDPPPTRLVKLQPKPSPPDPPQTREFLPLSQQPRRRPG